MDMLGAGVKAYGSIQAGQAKQAQSMFQASIATRNQLIATQNADYSRQVGEVDAQTAGIKTSQTVGLEKAGQGASGLDVNFGSAAQVRDSTQEIGWHDQQVIRSDAARKAYSYTQEAVNQGIQSQMYMKAGEDAETAGEIGATSSILGGMSSTADKWAKAATLGM